MDAQCPSFVKHFTYGVLKHQHNPKTKKGMDAQCPSFVKTLVPNTTQKPRKEWMLSVHPLSNTFTYGVLKHQNDPKTKKGMDAQCPSFVKHFSQVPQTVFILMQKPLWPKTTQKPRKEWMLSVHPLSKLLCPTRAKNQERNGCSVSILCQTFQSSASNSFHINAKTPLAQNDPKTKKGMDAQ